MIVCRELEATNYVLKNTQSFALQCKINEEEFIIIIC